MAGSGPCELHDAAIVVGTGDSESLLRLVRSPIGDECHQCSVCRWARTFIERRLAERAGRVLPSEENAEAAWKQLHAAIDSVRTSVHRPR